MTSLRRSAASMIRSRSLASRAAVLRNAGRCTTTVLLVGALLACGCGKKTATGPAPEEHLPPSVVETFPAARATRVSYETAMWARFREPLDSTTVSATTVFLKIDTRRIPVTVSLEDSARTIVIRPFGSLELRRTHTVELSPQVRTAAGARLGQTYFWQFTTIAVRRPVHPEPAAAADFESPVAPLFWSATDGAGLVEYRVFIGADSAEVEAETMTPVVVRNAYHLPEIPWERGATVFWKVHARNLETNDTAVGPVWRFQVVPPGAEITGMLVRAAATGYWDDQFKVWRCPSLTSGTRAAGVLAIDFAQVDSNLVVAEALVVIRSNTNITNFHNPQLYELVNDQAPCDERFLGVPKIREAPLAGGIQDAGLRVQFNSVALATQVQARVRRHPEFHDYSLRSERTIAYDPGDPGSGLFIYYFVPPASPASAHP